MPRLTLQLCAAVFAALLATVPASAQRPTTPPPQTQQPDTTHPKSTREVVIDKLHALDKSELPPDTAALDSLSADSLNIPNIPTKQQQQASKRTPRVRAGNNGQPQQAPLDFPTDSVMQQLMKLPE